MTYTLPHHENKQQLHINNVSSCILGNQPIARLLELITEPLTALIGINTKYKWKNTDFKIIDITNCKTCHMYISTM